MLMRNSLVLTLTVIVIVTLAMGVMGCSGADSQQDAEKYDKLDQKLEQAAANSNPDDPTVFYQDGRGWFHKQGCQRLRRGSAQVLSVPRSEAVSMGLEPCVVCKPDTQ